VSVSKLNVETDYNIKVRFYNRENIMESSITVRPNTYQIVSVDIENSSWQYFDNVEKIKIWFSVDDTTVQAGTIKFDEIGFYKDKKGCKSSVGGVGILVGLTCLSLVCKKKKEGIHEKN